MANSGAAVKLRRLRHHFGINAPKLSIRRHVPWYWRLLGLLAIISVSLAIAAWLYEAGRGAAGAREEAAAREIQTLRNQVQALDDDLAKMRTLAGSGESSLQIERETRRQLTRQIKALENENAALREDLTFFEGLLPSIDAESTESGLRIDHFRIAPGDAPDEYRYRLLVINRSGGRKVREFKGSLQFSIVLRQGGNDAMITVPSGEASPSDSGRYLVEVKHFHRIEGTFSVPAGAIVKSVEARLMQDGALRARQSLKL